MSISSTPTWPSGRTCWMGSFQLQRQLARPGTEPVVPPIDRHPHPLWELGPVVVERQRAALLLPHVVHGRALTTLPPTLRRSVLRASRVGLAVGVSRIAVGARERPGTTFDGPRRATTRVWLISDPLALAERLPGDGRSRLCARPLPADRSGGGRQERTCASPPRSR